MPDFGKLINATATFDPKPGLHYHLSCYVCGRACSKPSPFEGWVTFAQIFSSRPDGCRFAIARQLVLALEKGAVVNALDNVWVCWDLLDADVIRRGSDWGTTTMAAPAPLWTSPSEEGLVMKAMCLHDR